MLLQLKQEQSPTLDVIAVYRLDTDGHVGKWIIFWDLNARWRGPAYVCLMQLQRSRIVALNVNH